MLASIALLLSCVCGHGTSAAPCAGADHGDPACNGPEHAAATPSTVQLADGWQLAFDGQYRPRLTFDSGRDFANGDAVERLVVTHRARLGVVARHASGVGVTLRLRDVRAFGEEDDTLNDFTAAGLDLYEAFGEVRILDSLFLRVGRQALAFDDERLVGAVDWTQRGRSFDGIRVGWTRSRASVDVFFTWLAEDDLEADAHVPPARTGESYFAGLHGHMRVAEALGVAAAAYYRHQEEIEEDRHTVGLRLDGGAAGALYDVAFYYQLGMLGEEDIGAWLAALRGGFAAPMAWKPTVLVWGELLSGDGTKAGTFDTLFATNHKFYGEADFFTAIPAHTGLRGLVDVGGRIAVTPTPALAVLIDFHHFRGADDPDHVFGHEVDLKLTWRPITPLSIQPLYAVFISERPPGFAGTEPVTEHTLHLTTDFQF
jgi:hypothetical protein